MKQFKIEVSHASPAQLLTIAAELKIMSNQWVQFGPRILINGEKLQAPRHKLTADEAASRKQQASRNGLS
jgi:phenylacetate-coenzyme A ligase PaaK-like adenylate-forming protein